MSHQRAGAVEPAGATGPGGPAGQGGTDTGDRAVLRSSAIMAAGSIVSRITGIARDFTIGAAFGVGLVADAYALGNTLPTVVYILVIGGALNAVFIPQLVRRMADDEDGGKAYADRLLTLVTTALVVLTTIAVLAAPWLVRLYSFGSGEDQISLATTFARYCLPQIVFYGLYTLFTQVLNARGHFGLPMFTPILNNLVAIFVFGSFLVVAGSVAAGSGTLSPEQTAWLGIGSTVGIAIQALVLLPALWASGYVWRPRFDWRGAGLGKAGGLAIWTIGLVLVNQLAYVVTTNLASYANNIAATDDALVSAGLATYQRAYLVFFLPHGIITVSVVAALLPRMSRAAHIGDFRGVGHDVAGGMRLVSAAIIPVAALGIVTAPALLESVFAFGATSAPEARLIGVVTSAFLVGLLPSTLFYVLLRGWYALEDTRTPFWLTVGYNVVNLAIAVPLFFLVPDSLKVISLALSYSVAYWATFAVTWWRLRRRIGDIETYRTVRSLVRMSIAALLSAGIAFGVQAAAFRWLPFGGRLELLTAVALAGAVGMAAYLWCARRMRVQEIADVLALVRRRLPG